MSHCLFAVCILVWAMQVRAGYYALPVQRARCELLCGWYAEHLCPLQLSSKQTGQCCIKLSVHGHPGPPLQIPDHPAETGSEGEDSDCAWGCPSLRNQQEPSGFPPVLTTLPPAFSALSQIAALNTSRAAESPSRRAGERLGSGAGLRASSGSQRDGRGERERRRLWARLSPRAGERGRAPGDTFFSFGDDGSVSCVSGAAGQGMCQLLPIVCWRLH